MLHHTNYFSNEIVATDSFYKYSLLLLTGTFRAARKEIALADSGSLPTGARTGGASPSSVDSSSLV